MIHIALISTNIVDQTEGNKGPILSESDIVEFDLITL